MSVLSVLSVLLAAVIRDSTLRISVAALCGFLLSQDLFTGVNMLTTILMAKTQLPLFNRLSIVNIKDSWFSAGIFDKTYLLKSTKSILIFLLFSAIRNVLLATITLCVCIILHNELNGSQDASTVLGYLLVGKFVLLKLILCSRQLYILQLVKNPLMYHYARFADNAIKLKKYRRLLVTIFSVINVLFHKGTPMFHEVKCFEEPCVFLSCRPVILDVGVPECYTAM